MQNRITAVAADGGSWTDDSDTQMKYAKQDLRLHKARRRHRPSRGGGEDDASQWGLCGGHPQWEILSPFPAHHSGQKTTNTTGSHEGPVNSHTSKVRTKTDWLHFILITVAAAAVVAPFNITPPGVCADDSSQDFQKNSRCQHLFSNFHTHYAKILNGSPLAGALKCCYVGLRCLTLPLRLPC